MMSDELIESFARVARSPDPDLAVAALMIARVGCPNLDARPYLARLDELGREAARRIAGARPALGTPPRVDPSAYARVAALNDYLFSELRFVGNDVQFDDPRNSFLNEVLDRRTGIPITLALVYMEVARRAGVEIHGVNFPGHFLLRCPAPAESLHSQDMIIDAHHGGALVTESMCRELLRKHIGESAMWDDSVLAHASKPQIMARVLLNLKRVYVGMYSFPQARLVTELLLAVDPLAVNELRDRGLLAYHLRDFASALRDLQAYLRLSARSELGEEEREEQSQIWEHIKALRRRMASLN